VQASAARMFHLEKQFPTDGSQFDRLWNDGDGFSVGEVACSVLATPGHTPDSVTYLIGDCAFVGDTLFLPYLGTARCDFPGGSARALWHSIQRILSLPDDTRLFTGHDYMPGRREPRWESTVRQQKTDNIHLQKTKSEAEFVQLREQRDRTLAMPKLILAALQVNINAGRLPEPESNGERYLKIPLNALENAVWDE